MISPLITVVINLYLVISSLLSAYFKSEQVKLNICVSFFNAGCGQKSSLKKVCSPQKKWFLYCIKHLLSLFLIQITHPIRCTTTSHVITQTILATVLAHVWWPRISVRSSACVSMSVSLTFARDLKFVAVKYWICGNLRNRFHWLLGYVYHRKVSMQTKLSGYKEKQSINV